MSRLRLGLLAVALCVVGCVPTTEPLSDVEKADPDKNLVGGWIKTYGSLGKDFAIDIPAVKGNPKGLMRIVRNSNDPDDGASWFYTSTINKKTYANEILDRTRWPETLPSFSKEGAFAVWQKSDKRAYFIYQYTLNGDELVIDGGNGKDFEKLAIAEKFMSRDPFYATPKGWLADYLKKNGEASIFDESNKTVYSRSKK